MTIETTLNKNTYTGDGVATSFDFNFAIYEKADLEVTHTDNSVSPPVNTILTLGVDYNIATGWAAGSQGSIDYPVSGSPLPATEQLTLRGAIPAKQKVDIKNQGGFNAETHERVFDKLTRIAQNLSEQIARSIKLPVQSSSTDLEIPEPEAGKALVWNEAADALENGPDSGDIANAQTYATQAQTAKDAAETAQTGAETAETNAAASVVAALAAVDSVGWNDVLFLTFADSPYTVNDTHRGTLIVVDTSGGNVTINLPSIAGATMPFGMGIKKGTGDVNIVTAVPNGTDTIDGVASYSATKPGAAFTLAADIDTSPDSWTTISYGVFSGTDPDAVHFDEVNEFTGVAEKVTPVNADLLLIEDSAAGNAKKRVQLANLPYPTVGAGDIGQAELKTSTGEVSATTESELLTLPGGAYGFYPQFKVDNATRIVHAALHAKVDSYVAEYLVRVTGMTTAYVTRINLGTNGGTIYAQQRYVTASPPYNLGHGDIPLFIFAVVDNATGDIVSTYAADTPPWIYNGPTQAWADAYSKDGKQLRKQRVPAAVAANRFLNQASMDAYLLAKEQAKGKYEVITNDIKNADMGIVPHPFMPRADHTIVVLDPLSGVVDKAMQLVEDGEGITDIIRSHVNIDNAPIVAGFHESVMTVGAAWKQA